MSEKQDLKKIARELGLDRPIMATRVVGNRLEIYPLGGPVLTWPLESDLPGSGSKAKVTQDSAGFQQDQEKSVTADQVPGDETGQVRPSDATRRKEEPKVTAARKKKAPSRPGGKK